jgi:receptor expression-enhancing protein 1/2/3/4
LWYPRTKGTTYIYGTFFKPYISQHENEIDRNLLELRARASDVVVVYFQKAASVGQSTFFDVLKYVASQSPSQKSKVQRSQEPQQQQPQPQVQQQQQAQKQGQSVMRRAASIAARQAAMAQQSQETKPLSPKIKRQASAKGGPMASTKAVAAAAATKPDDSTKKSEAKPVELVPVPAAEADVPKTVRRVELPPEAEGVDDMAVDEADDSVEGAEEAEPSVEEESVMEETIRVTRAKLRRRAAAEASA